MYSTPGTSPLLRAGLLGLLVAAAPPCPAETFEVVIGGGVLDPLPIAVVPFERPALLSDEPDPARVITEDLRNSGVFRPIPPADMPQHPRQVADVRFADWRRIGVESLVIGRVVFSGADAGYQLEYRLFDVYREEQVSGQRLNVQAGSIRRAAHRFSDDIYQQLTGEPGVFSTYVIFVSIDEQQEGAGRYRLEVADYDGYNARVLLVSREPLLSPSWSPAGDRIAYVSFEKGSSAIYVQELRSGKRRRVSASPGINSAPRFSPEGGRLALTLSKDGNPEIYVLHIAGGLLQRITDHPAIDTEPDWSPDGNSLVFTSDRGGHPQIYRALLRTGEVRRVTFDGRYNAGATHSPDGRLLAMVHSGGGDDYRIAYRSADGSDALQLIDGDGLDESPVFAPNGRLLLYAAGDRLALAPIGLNRPSLTIDRPGMRLREPAWGPLPSR